MIHTRLLEEGCEPGADILYMKQRLYNMGMLETEIDASIKTEFDEEMRIAVLNFQDRNKINGEPIELTGQIDAEIWDAIIREHNTQYLARTPIFNEDSIMASGESIGKPFIMPYSIHPDKAEAIAKDLGGVSYIRRAIVMEALRFAYDPAVPRYYPISLYIIGKTLYDKYGLGEPMIVTDKIIDQQDKRYLLTEEKVRMMREAISFDRSITGADDCGGIVGLCHFAGVCKIGTDVPSKSLASDLYSTAINKEELQPGDWLYKPHHIGLYVGGGYGVEWIGVVFGCQLTAIDDRVGYNFVKNAMVKLSPWENYRRPKWY